MHDRYDVSVNILVVYTGCGSKQWQHVMCSNVTSESKQISSHNMM